MQRPPCRGTCPAPGAPDQFQYALHLIEHVLLIHIYSIIILYLLSIWPSRYCSTLRGRRRTNGTIAVIQYSQIRARARAHTHTHKHTQARTHARTHMHTHTHMRTSEGAHTHATVARDMRNTHTYEFFRDWSWQANINASIDEAFHGKVDVGRSAVAGPTSAFVPCIPYHSLLLR